jgi:hypothetical protein
MKIIVSFILLLFFLQACKDKNPTDSSINCSTNPSECQYASEAKEFFSFKVGSWWVYEEQTSHERDSVYCTINNNSGTSYFYTETISARDSFKTRWFTKNMYEYNGCSTTEPIGKSCLYVYKTKLKDQNHLGENILFFVKYKKGDFIYNTGGTNYCLNNKMTIANISESFTLPNFSFNNKTVEITEDCTHFEGDQPTVFIYTKGVGLIQKKLLGTNETWNLVSYHIEP